MLTKDNMNNSEKNIVVLLVEDTIGDAQAITRAILYGDIAKDYVVLKASRLKESIAILNSRDVDIVLLDLSLPDARDINAVVEIKVMFPNIPIIVLSDNSDERTIQRTLLSGASNFLSKSETSGILIRKVIDNLVITSKEKALEKV